MFFGVIHTLPWPVMTVDQYMYYTSIASHELIGRVKNPKSVDIMKTRPLRNVLRPYMAQIYVTFYAIKIYNGMSTKI